MSRYAIIKKIEDEFSSFSRSRIERIIRNRKYIQKKSFSIININGDRKVLDKLSLSEENQILMRYYQLLLKENFRLKSINRNVIISELLNITPYIFNYYDKSIYKFDISNFYPTLDIDLIFAELRKNDELFPDEINFLVNTFNTFDNLYPGLGIINNLSEILGKKFDHCMEALFSEHLIYYSRYVDDCILIFDEAIDEKYLQKTISDLLKEIFGTKVGLNNEKTEYVDFKIVNKFDYLGYSFSYEKNNNSLIFKFGIANKKLDKQKAKLCEITNSYLKGNKDQTSLNKLIFRIDLYYKRLVFFNNEKKNEESHWEVRGISQVYSELKKYIKRDNKGIYSMNSIDKKTEQLITGKIFYKLFKGNVPKELENHIENKKFIANLHNNRAIILNKKIGYSYDKLYEILEVCGIDINRRMSYENLANLFIANLYIK